MSGYKYLIVGGSLAADAAVKGIREVDSSGTIGLISDDSHPPYSRPPLSKALWKGKPVDSLWRHTEKYSVDLMLGRRALRLDLAGQAVLDDRGAAHHFDRLLLATGGRPRRLPFGGDHILYYRTLDDFQQVWHSAQRHQHFAIIGGGFIGAEMAAALALNGQRVTMLFPAAGIGARTFPADLANFLVEYYREKGVEVRPGETVRDVVSADGRLSVLTASGAVAVDGVVAGIGLQPNVELAQAAGLAVDNGIVVDERLRTSQPDIYAAGDVAAFYSPALGMRMRVEHEDNALTMGRLAGRNMAGEETAYTHLPFFYSDLFDLGYEAVGELDARLETVVDWKVPYREGVVYYQRGGRVRGVLLWNVWNQIDAARALIAADQTAQPLALPGRLPAVV